MSVPKKDIEPEIEIEEDEEPSLPPMEEMVAAVPGEPADNSLAAGRDAILRYAKLAPAQPGVYRMIDARGDVLYVGKAKNVRESDSGLCPAGRPRYPDRADDRGDSRA